MTTYGPETEKKIDEVLDACNAYGSRSIIALEGVPGTGKSFMASIAAQRFTDEPILVREIQFHQSYSYEEFIEGMRIAGEGVAVVPGVFLDWNQAAHEDPDRKYVLLIEELTRANLPSVLGELMTFLEYRDRPFMTIYSRRPVRVAKNLTVVATYNPTDRSALELDAALLRRMRVIRFEPSTAQLKEMLQERLSASTISRLAELFDKCKTEFPDQNEQTMPFGHGIFSEVQNERPDLHRLWVQRISHMLRRPLMEPHPFTDTIEENYPWRDPEFQVTAPAAAASPRSA